ncbi:DNA mismatch repair endonuclease MutL [Nannocystis punicea]|uniref:DNA mismatch repair protein MutL n=1 Tax=Nannocystis punicea TaxID=2995304 RepID=A0ABY7HGC7_9BACT|nr:DNA mismatch repair endonuclease MutL [Nannocystis poenicansa]WAS98368.1 DNA mismatch repair endonuclease MutL [Nannocystis poenicansa]
MNSPAPAASGRIAVLGALVIDQIAAGEVVERPASVVKELVDNSLDAGATRIDVELEDGGMARISVRDNGRGIHPDDLLLAVTRHATSKLRHAADIADITTLGFRGEALASVAAVARVDLRSRQPGAAVGVHLHGIPGEAPTLTPAGMPVGTQIEVHALFANLPARRKFMRAEATEVGHCSDTLLRLAIVHPGVHFTLRHGKRELLNLPRATREGRVAQVLERRVAGPFFVFSGEDDGIRVEAHLPHPTAAARGRGSPYLVTRQRVVRERSLAQILTQAYGLGGEAPSACLFVEPPAGAVDVNVHPQKAEVRFSEPQQVYAAVRRVLAAAVAAAPWAGEIAGLSGQGATNMSDRPAADEARAPVGVPPGRGGAIPIGFAPVRVGEPARVGSEDDEPSGATRPTASARRRAGRDEADEDDDAPPASRRPLDDARLASPRPPLDDEGDHSRRSGRQQPLDDEGDHSRRSGRRPPLDEGDEDGLSPAFADDLPGEDDGPGPAVRRAQQAAAAAAAGRRAEAEAWLSRAEASIDAARRPLVETDRSPSTPPPRPRSGPLTAATPAGDPGWDLDLAASPAASRDMSLGAGDERTRSGERASSDMALRADTPASGGSAASARPIGQSASSDMALRADAPTSGHQRSRGGSLAPAPEGGGPPASSDMALRAEASTSGGSPASARAPTGAPAPGGVPLRAEATAASSGVEHDSQGMSFDPGPASADRAGDGTGSSDRPGDTYRGASTRSDADEHVARDMSVRAGAHGPRDMSLRAATDGSAEEPAPRDMSLDPDSASPPELRAGEHVSRDMSLRARSPAGEHDSPDTDASAAWLTRAGAVSEHDPARDRAAAWVERAGGEFPADLRDSADPLLRWSERQPDPPPPPPAPAEERRPGAYRLSTRALDHGYDRHKRAVMEAAAALRPDGAAPRPVEPEREGSLELLPNDVPGLAPGPRDMREQTGPSGQAAPATAPQRPDIPALLACLPGPVAVFADRDALLAVDLRRVRSHLVYLRLQRDLVGRRAVAVQGLLSPAVVQRPAADVALIQAARTELLGLGVDLDVFGDDAVVVRGVPAHLRHCVDDADAADLVARIVPWLRIRSSDDDRAARERGLLDAIAATSGGDPAPRLARRWLAELVDAGAALDAVPGIRRWTASALLGGG